MSEFTKNKNEYINKLMNLYTNKPPKNKHNHNKPIDKSLKIKIEASVNRGVIYKIREISETENYICYVRKQEQDLYRDLLYGEFPEFNRNNLYQMIEKFFISKDETFNSDTINQIIDLMINHTFIELWTHLFLSHIDVEPIISLTLKRFKLKNQKIYNNLLTNFADNNHECIDYKLNKLKPVHHCIICGYIYCQYIY